MSISQISCIFILITISFPVIWEISANKTKYESHIERVGVNARRSASLNLTYSQFHNNAHILLHVFEGQNLRVTSETRVAVLIRAHDSYAIKLINLLWCLEAQDYPFEIYALILPTEYNSIKTLKRRLNLDWKNSIEGHKKKVTAQLLDLTERHYLDHCCELDKICTAEWRKRKLKERWSSDSLQRYCSANNPLHYYLADIALGILLSSCSTCNGLFITNADNSYAPSFISRTVTYLSPSAEMNVSRKNDSLYELVLVDMLSNGKSLHVVPRLSKMDLGCVMISFSFLNNTQSKFLSSLPVPAEPQDYHNADYWFVRHMMNLGARLHVIHEVLFNHY